MLDLTYKQKRILYFLKENVQKSGYPPTVREIGERFGILWAAARMHLKAIERKGFIKINPAKSRGIEVLGLHHSEGTMAPVAGKIRAGRPILAVEDINSHIFIDKKLFPAEDAFSLKVTGDSMLDGGILDGDFVIVRPQSTIKNGEIGVVLIGDEATVKRIFKEKDKVTLKPENKNMTSAIYKSDEVIIMGKVIGVIRKV